MSESIAEGFLLIDKPAGITSHDVIDRLRHTLKTRRIGHAGTLDPFATGLLLIGVGPKTKELSRYVGLDKIYEATFILGATSTTDDKDGVITLSSISNDKFQMTNEIGNDQIQKAIKELTGQIEQIPPTYSAIKIKGKKMYEAAREGKPIIAPPRKVTVHSFELLSPPTHDSSTLRLSFRIHCSSGTYIRALARDLGDKLGVGGYVGQLRRTAIGPFTINQAQPLPESTPQV